jgi:hypothetical protein
MTQQSTGNEFAMSTHQSTGSDVMTQQSTGIDENDDGDLKDTTINQQRHNNQPAVTTTQQSTSSDDNTTINRL